MKSAAGTTPQSAATAVAPARAAILAILRQPYESSERKTQDLDEIVFGASDKKEGVELLKELLSLAGLDLVDPNAKLVKGAAKLPEGKKFSNELSRLKKFLEEKAITCCDCFVEKTADEAAKTAYEQLTLIGEKVGKVGRMAWLAYLMMSNHVPFLDIPGDFGSFTSEELRACLREDPTLFAQAMNIFKRGNSIREMATWVTSVPCEPKMKAMLMVTMYALLREQVQQSDPLSALFSLGALGQILTINS